MNLPFLIYYIIKEILVNKIIIIIYDFIVFRFKYIYLFYIIILPLFHRQVILSLFD